MSLKVWLPLNGDLRNLGCSNIEVTNNGATVNDNGKIGKCYYFDGNGHYLQLSKSVGNLYSGDFSWAVWLKPADSTRSIISSEYSSTGASNVAFELSASRGIRIYWNGSPDIYPSNSTLPLDTWTHVAITKTTGIIKTYINGILTHTYTGTLSNRPSTSYIRIGDDYRGGTSVSYMGYMNDWRLYDHCLSTAEVHEIAQGLVLHYKLDGINNPSVLPSQYQQLEYIESAGTSYFDTGYKFNAEIDSCKVIFKGNDTSNNGMIFASSGTKYFWFYYYGSNGIRIYAHNGSDGQKGIIGISSDLIQHTMEFKNKTYYIDDVNKGSLTDTYTDTTNNIWLFSYNNNGYPFKGRIYYVEIKKNNQYQRIFIPAKRLNDSAIGMYDLITNTFYTSSNVAFTAGTAVGTLTIEDSSGYGNNGEIGGSIITQNSSSRYNYNIKLNDSASSIKIGNLANYMHDGLFTFNIWFKKTTGEWSSKTWETILGGPSGFELEGKISNTQNAYIHPYSWGGGSTTVPKDGYSIPYTLDEWHMLTMVRSTSNAKFYLDGELQVTGSAGSIPSGDYFIGSWKNATSQNYRGELSDARFYVTQLLDNDIKVLYNTTMRIDPHKNIHNFELNENAPYNKLTPTGMLEDNMVESYLTLSDGSKWKLMLFHYVDGGTNLFTSSNATYCNEWGLYSRLSQITNYQYDGKYEYYVIQDGTEFRWTQTSSPTASSISGLTTVSGYNNPVNGLAKASQNNTYIGYGAWWGACGCWTSYSTGGKTGIPGFGSHDANGICTKYLILYTRVSDFGGTFEDGTAFSNNFIEM